MMSGPSKKESAVCDAREVQMEEHKCVQTVNKDGTNLNPEDRWPFLISKTLDVHLDTIEKNFVFYDIDNFLQLRFDLPPNNKYVRIAGYVHIMQDVIYLRPQENVCRKNVNIKFGSFVDYPEPGTLIEVFGKLHFEKTEKRFLPNVQVYFHRKLIGSYAEYVELYQILKSMR